ncbi:MAG: CARDB domain-containing protein [Acidobacteriota bacterium]
MKQALIVLIFMVTIIVGLTAGIEDEPDRVYPDLTVRIDKVPEMAVAGEDLGYIYVSVKNSGKVAKKGKENYCVFLILSKDKKIPVVRPPLDESFSEDMAIGAGMCSSRKLRSRKVWKIDYFGEKSDSDQMMIHKDTPPGDYFLAVVVDAGQEIQESNEKNNTHYVPIKIISIK